MRLMFESRMHRFKHQLGGSSHSCVSSIPTSAGIVQYHGFFHFGIGQQAKQAHNRTFSRTRKWWASTLATPPPTCLQVASDVVGFRRVLLVDLLSTNAARHGGLNSFNKRPLFSVYGQFLSDPWAGKDPHFFDRSAPEGFIRPEGLRTSRHMPGLGVDTGGDGPPAACR